MANASCKDQIRSVLKEMKKESFKEFKEYLNDEESMQPYRSIPLSELENADHVDVANLLVRHYTRGKALKVTLKILIDIKEMSLAEKLRPMLYSTEVKQESKMDEDLR
ncbi:NACHT, LRR and PYD domains-containing protein 4-like isoform 1-T1 [Mantella aurantiaca]